MIGLKVYSICPSTIARNEVLQLTDELHKAEKNRDEEKLKKILAREIFYNQEIISKEEFVGNIKNIDIDIESIEAALVSSKVVSNEQVNVCFTMQITFIGEDRKPFEHIGDYIYTFEKQQNEWKLISIDFKK